MVLNEWVQIVYDEFFKSFQLRDELFLGEFVLMPDHLHAIVILDKTKCMDGVTNDDDVRDNDARQCNDERLKAAQPHKFGWEKQFAEGFAEKDIDENRLRAAIRLGVESGRIAPTANGESIDSLLGKLKLKKDGQPTNAAVMLFAKDTSDYPQLLLRMARFMGTDKNEFFDNQRQQGNFFDLLDAGMQFAYKHLNISGKIVGVHRIDKLEIPIEALREALINALCHRTYDNPGTSVSLAIYDDRVEIVNPGRLPNELTVETMMQPHESHPMNPDIANVLFKTTYLENWGSGVNRIVTACKSANAPTPFYELRPGGLAIVFPRPKDSDVGNNVGENVGNNQEVADKVANKVANKSAQNVLVLLYNNGHLTREQLCAKTGLSLGGIKKILNSLREKGLIERVGGNKTGYWKVHI